VEADLRMVWVFGGAAASEPTPEGVRRS
jgi:hypothetical protein